MEEVKPNPSPVFILTEHSTLGGFRIFAAILDEELAQELTKGDKKSYTKLVWDEDEKMYIRATEKLRQELPSYKVKGD